MLMAGLLALALFPAASSASCGNPIQAEMIIKLKSGKTTYSEMPKSDLSGSYSLHRLMSDDSLFKSILQYYKLSDIYVGIA